ncbi:MAG: ATPase, T2SS/T4P/T4SS family [Candidatus Micrarchaeia archaeon]|jgi:ATPase
MRYVCDTSVIIDGRILELVEKGEVKGEIVIHEASIAEMENQSNMKKETGYAGFAVLRKLREMEKAHGITVLIKGERPTPDEIRGAKRTGQIDFMVRRLAKAEGATLITGDTVQHNAAEAEGIKTIYLRAHELKGKLSFEHYFDAKTMSLHLKEGCKPVLKKGGPARVEIVEVPEIITEDQIRKLGEEIVEATGRNITYYFEIDRVGASVIQMGEYRIVIAKPPFSDGFEITIVRPIKKNTMADYEVSEKLKARIDQQAEGIIVCGPPGSGKSTFAAALAEYYHSKKYVVKTMESPRDMRVIQEITQYTALEGDFEYTKEILLLVRPDYTFYDEMRKSKDFNIYTDMRLTGIGLVGVVHGRKAIDAIQRFIGKVDLGVIPQVVDTVIMIDGGQITQVYELSHTVKVPAGMREQDLARPVIEVKDFETGEPEYEIYKFGEETVVLPLGEAMARGRGRGRGGERGREGGGQFERALSRLMQNEFKVEKVQGGFLVRAKPNDITYLFKQGRKKLRKLENRYGKIEVREL